MSLTEREKLILGEIVRSFISTASPVSSTLIAKNRRMQMSPATIRNIMASLEQKGYIHQPHTSSGRVPKTAAYRTYVDSLMRRTRLSSDEKGKICEPIQHTTIEFDEILKEMTRILAQLSRQLGVVLSPQIEQGVFQKIELVSLASDKVLVIISIESGLLKTITLEVDSVISGDKLYLISQILNERLHGLKITDIRHKFSDIVQDLQYADNGFLKFFSRQADRVFDFGENIEMYFMGTHHILQKEDFSNLAAVSSVMEMLENRNVIAQLLETSANPASTSVKIGEEIEEERMQECSMITARYKVGNINGVLGIIGPTRMNYSKLVALVEYTAQAISEEYGKN